MLSLAMTVVHVVVLNCFEFVLYLFRLWQLFAVKYSLGNVTFRDIFFFNAALKVAFVLLAGETNFK